MKEVFFDDRIKKVMSSVLGVGPDLILPTSSQDSIENWDSLKHMNLILALEEEFGITIPDEDAANLPSFRLIQIVVSELTPHA
jgi:acyl carrier protein